MEYGKGHPKKYGYLEIQNTVDAAWPGLSPLVAPPTKTDLDKNWNWFQLQIIASNQTQSQWDRILVWYQTSPRNKKNERWRTCHTDNWLGMLLLWFRSCGWSDNPLVFFFRSGHPLVFKWRSGHPLVLLLVGSSHLDHLGHLGHLGHPDK